jgi:tRNA A-37 threonylcarbamoyl transferase component Bud32
VKELFSGDTASMGYKNNSETIIKKTSHVFLICKREYSTAAMQQLLTNPDEYLDTTPGPIFKNIPGDTSTVGVVIVDNKKYVVKRYNVRGFWHGLRKIFRPNRALRSWNNSHYLDQHHIPTPKPVAVIIKHFGPIRGKTYFITEYVDGVQGLNFFEGNTKTDAVCKKILENVAELLKKLYVARITHDDFQLKNIIIVNNIPFLLDLDYMRIHKYNSVWFRHNYRKDVENFLRHLDKINPDVHSMAKMILDQGN